MSIPRIPDYPVPAPESFPANRTQWRPDPQRAVLLIHDMQRYFMEFYDPAGTLARQLIGNIGRLRSWARKNGVPVVYTAQPHLQPAGDRALLNDMWGPGLPAAEPDRQNIVTELAPEAGDIVLPKWRYSAFRRSDLLQIMQAWKRDQLVIAGIYAHIGCMITAVDAFMNDIQPFLVGDAVADFSEKEHRMALQYVATRCGAVVDTAEVANGPPSSVTREWLQEQVLRFVEDETDFDPEENLILHGLDSLQVMRLTAELKNRGISVGFDELIRDSTLAAWWALIEQKQINRAGRMEK